MYDTKSECKLKIIEEKHELHKCGNIIGGSMLILKIIGVIVSFGIVVIFGAITNDIERFQQLVKNDLIFSNILNIIVNTLTIFVPFLIFAICTRKKNNYTTSFSKPKTTNKETVTYIFFGTFLLYVAGIFRLFVSFLLSFFAGKEPYVPALGRSYDNALVAFAVEIICSCLITAIIEEFAFRGVLLSYLRKFGDMPAIIISSLIFALMHGNFVQLPYTFVFAIGLSFITIKTESIYPAIISHFINNSMATLSDWSSSATSIFALTSLILGIVATVALKKHHKFNLPKAQNFQLSSAKRTSTIILSLFLIIYIVLELVLSSNYLQ